jgi:hypothetical protein
LKKVIKWSTAKVIVLKFRRQNLTFLFTRVEIEKNYKFESALLSLRNACSDLISYLIIK